MGFFDGTSSDDSQWVALSANVITCFLYGFLIRKEVKNKGEQRRINKKNETFIYKGVIILAILAAALYYIIREKVFLKDKEKKGKNFVSCRSLPCSLITYFKMIPSR